MATNPTSAGWGIDQPDGGAAEATFFEKLGAKTETKLEDFFQWWGTIMASRPWIVLFLGKFLTGNVDNYCVFLCDSKHKPLLGPVSEVCETKSLHIDGLITIIDSDSLLAIK